jgi:hypothetical protein
MGFAQGGRAAGALGAASIAVALVAAPLQGAFARVMVPTDGAYVKECGACHMPFSPQLLPAASWRKVMGGLDNHFGESAGLDAPTRDKITAYLVGNSADHASSEESRSIMGSIGPSEVPPRITQVPWIAGLHAAVLDPMWSPNPHPKTLAECAVCHTQATTGNYRIKDYSVTDERFRPRDEDWR